MLLALAMAACGAGGAPAPRTATAPLRPAPPAPTIVAPAPPSAPPSALPATTATTPPTLSPTDLADGRYWIRRATGEVSRGSDGAGLAGPGEAWVALRTACVALDLGRDGGPRTLAIARADALAPSPPVAADDGVTFRLDDHPAAAGAWRLSGPRLARAQPAVALVGRCVADVTVATLPVFPDRDACLAAPTTATRRCRGDLCQFDGPAPLWLDGCEDELRRLARAVEPVVAASHGELVRSLERLTRIAGRGGRLWYADEDDGRCYPLVATPGPDDHVRLRDSHPLRGGGKVTYEADVVLEPLFRRARYARESRSSEGPHGGGGRGIGDFTAGLFLGRDAVLLADRWFFFDRATCRQVGDR
ncbi:MAG: hypothetical protein IPH44_26890 [Myxococcales bacterium]|nr:hypothetical protein [Myxococcales bacterium]MBK7196373.1 hypothetical protein [Myxococcales bacterium]MBP6847019.1 hypothetical protein [Kofleriaceae bacterium]